MAIERSFLYKQETHEIEAAQAGEAFAQYMRDGDYEQATHQLEIARQHLDLAQQTQRTWQSVREQLNMIGGDVPIPQRVSNESQAAFLNFSEQNLLVGQPTESSGILGPEIPLMLPDIVVNDVGIPVTISDDVQVDNSQLLTPHVPEMQESNDNVEEEELSVQSEETAVSSSDPDVDVQSGHLYDTGDDVGDHASTQLLPGTVADTESPLISAEERWGEVLRSRGYGTSRRRRPIVDVKSTPPRSPRSDEMPAGNTDNANQSVGFKSRILTGRERDLLLGGNTKTSEVDKLSYSSVSQSAPEQKRVRNDFGERQERMVNALLAINEEGTDFLYPDIKDAMVAAHRDILDVMDEKTRKNRTSIYRSAGQIEIMMNGIVKKIDNALQQRATDKEDFAMPPAIDQFIRAFEQNPAFAGIPSQEIVRMLSREVTFAEIDSIRMIPGNSVELTADQRLVPNQTAELGFRNDVSVVPEPEKQPDQVVFSPAEIRHIAKVLSLQDVEHLKKIGISLNNDELADLIHMLDEQVEDDHILMSELSDKLNAYLKDKKRVFNTHSGSENQDAAYVLSILSTVQSEADLERIFPRE